MTIGKTIALTIWPFVGRVMSPFFNTLSRFVIAFLLRSKLSSDFMAAVTICRDFGVQEEEICYYFHLSPFMFCAAMGADALILVLPREKEMSRGRAMSKSVTQVLVFVCVVSKNMICQ